MKQRGWMVLGVALAMVLGGASLARERQPGNDHGRRTHQVQPASQGHHPEPGDDHGGHGHDDGPRHH